ncbi:hypothetical protein [Paraburkholderia sp. C35]|uniref:hypothetical protein n=1 Tax=Paraburkholderia sp. C35 TaxID=2126993 RepID=UPI0013A561FA|nr:hypothetical protein [Paraburkholderia sp. C35]
MPVKVDLFEHVSHFIQKCFGSRSKQCLRNQPLGAPELSASQCERRGTAEQHRASGFRRVGTRQHPGRALLEIESEFRFREKARFVAMRLKIHCCVSVLHRLPMK